MATFGEPWLLDDLLFTAGKSLVPQSVAPGVMSMLDVGGFGLGARRPGRSAVATAGVR